MHKALDRIEDQDSQDGLNLDGLDEKMTKIQAQMRERTRSPCVSIAILAVQFFSLLAPFFSV